MLKMIISCVIAVLLAAGSAIRPVPAPVGQAGAGAAEAERIYELELSRWGISNNMTRPAETTSGLNRALQWARAAGYTTVKVPAGTYLIAKGAKPNDPAARINMVGNLTLMLDDNAVFQKERNGFEAYELLRVGPEAKHATIRGGTFRGDKDTHDYTKQDSSSTSKTHESGCGIKSAGSVNLTIDGVAAVNFTGDGMCIGDHSKQINVFHETDFEAGGVSDTGQLTKETGRFRTKLGKTKVSDPVFQMNRTINFSNPINLGRNVPYDLVFYRKDGTFLSSQKNLELIWSYVDVPAEAAYFRAVFHASSFKGVRLEYWNRALSTNTVIANSEIAFNRRQGITVGGAQNITITGNRIHDIKGTAPQSGIDVEGGIYANGSLNRDIFIRSNDIYNNAAYNVILYDGYNATVENNRLGPNEQGTSVGLAVSEPFRKGVVVRNNTFEGSKIAVGHDVRFEGNQMIESTASITGPNVTIDGMTFTDATLMLTSRTRFGITGSNITMYHTNKTNSGLIINGQPVRLSNVAISGQSRLRSLSGTVADGSVFDNLTVTGYSNFGLSLPRGTYNNCVFEAAQGGTGEPGITQAGNYVFNACTFTGTQRGLVIASKEAHVTVSGSTFEHGGAGNVVYVSAAASFKLLDSTIRAERLPAYAVTRALVKVNDYGAANLPTDVGSATVEGNTIVANLEAKGISTVDAGIGAPPYLVRANVLVKARLQLRAIDINVNNTEK